MTRRRNTTPNDSTTSGSFVPPYPPSWFDRLTMWVDRLPGPPWAFYLALGTFAGLAQSAIQWREGAYPPGTFNPWHVWVAGYFAYQLGLMHYLDKFASSALASFRSVLVSAKDGNRASVMDHPTYARLSYELTTLPGWPALLAMPAGAAIAVLGLAVPGSKGIVPNALVGTAGTPLSTTSIMIDLALGFGMNLVLAYHTIHQLVLVSRIYTQHARINIYEIHTLYALSAPGAYTATGLMVMVAGFLATAPSQVRRIEAMDPLGIAIGIFFFAVAGATFVLPLLGAHRLLAAEKTRRVAENMSRFDATARTLHQDLDGRRLLHMDKLNRALANLEIEQNVLRKIPTWPWEPGAVRGVFAALLLPLAVWALQVLLGRLLGV